MWINLNYTEKEYQLKAIVDGISDQTATRTLPYYVILFFYFNVFKMVGAFAGKIY